MDAHFEQGWILDREREVDGRAWGEGRLPEKKREVEPDLLGLVPIHEPKHPKSNCAAKTQTRAKQQFLQSSNT